MATQLQTCRAQVTTLKAQLATCQTNVANQKTQIADLQAQLDALQNPVPDPVPPPTGFVPDSRTFGAYVNPYPTSPFNKPIPSNPAIHPNSANIIASMRSKGPAPAFNEQAGRGGTSNDFSHCVYLAKDTDPTMVLHQGYNSTWKNPDVEGVVIHVPAGAQPAAFQVAGSGTATTIDKSVGIIQPDGWEYDCWGVDHMSGGELACGFAHRGRIDGDGLGQGSAPYHGGITEAGYSNGLGVIQTSEWLAGEIKHAIFMTVNGWEGRVYPAMPSSRTGQGSGANRPAMGQHLQLDPSMSLASYPPWKQTILRAFQVYGGYVGDMGGAALMWWSHLESDTPYVALGKSPSNLQYADTHFGHTGAWDLGSGVDWSRMRVLQPPTP